MTPARLYIHAGLPRTATTALQRAVFPTLMNFDYIGKAWDNKPTPIQGNARELIQEVLSRSGENRGVMLESIGGLLSLILSQWKNANQHNDRTASKQLSQTWTDAVNATLNANPDRRLLLSDESLIESVIGLSSRLNHGYGIPLEQLANTGLLQNAVVSIVLREPADFMKASYYKNMEFEFKYKGQPISFDEYIRRHIAIYIRKPSASRIFMAMHKPFVSHLQQFCPTLVVNHYSRLIEAHNVVDALLGFQTGEKPIRLKDLPRDNSSFRDSDAVNFILSAKDVPSGISIDEYAKTFANTLEHYGLTAIFNESALSTPKTIQTQ